MMTSWHVLYREIVKGMITYIRTAINFPKMNCAVTWPMVLLMMTSSNGNIFCVTGHLCGEYTGPRWIPHTKPVTRSFDVFFDLRLNKRLSKQPWGWWLKTPSRSLWRHSNGMFSIDVTYPSCPCAGCAHQAYLGVRPGRVCLYNSAPCKRSITTNIAPGSRHLNWHFCCFLSQCTYTCYFIQ